MTGPVSGGNWKDVQMFFSKATDGKFKVGGASVETTEAIIEEAKILLEKPEVNKTKLEKTLRRVLTVVKEENGETNPQLKELIGEVVKKGFPRLPEDIYSHLFQFVPRKEGEGLTACQTVHSSKQITQKTKDQIIIDRVKENIKIVIEKRTNCPRSQYFRNIFKGTNSDVTSDEEFFRGPVHMAMTKFLESGIPRDQLLRVLKAIDPKEEQDATLVWACGKADMEIIKARLANPRSNFNTYFSLGLMLAAANGHQEILKLLLDIKRADLTASDERTDLNTCMKAITKASICAVANGHTKIVALLLKDKRADPAAHNSKALIDAASKGRAEVVKLLLSDRRADPAAQNSKALREAASKGRAKVVKLLLSDRRADPAAHNSKALREAAFKGHTDIVKQLLQDKRANPAAHTTVKP